jgi:hypothetical protein
MLGVRDGCLNRRAFSRFSVHLCVLLY